MYRTLNPYSGERLREFPVHSAGDIDSVLNNSASSYHLWKQMSLTDRAAPFLTLAKKLEENAKVYAELMALEMGKPVSQGEAEIQKCAATCRYYAQHSESFLRPEERKRLDGTNVQIRFDPLGPVFAIMPWNYPFWQVFRFAVASMMAGNVVVLKHAPNTPQCALAIEVLFTSSGFPAGVFQSVFVTNEQAADIISDRRIQGVTLTGSVSAGQAVGALASRNLKPVVLELGGSDPFIVLEDADVDKAAKVGATARCINSGQVCCAAKRFVVHTAVLDRFTEQFVSHMESQVLGDPLDSAVTMGPMAREDLKQKLQSQVNRCLELGSKVLTKTIQCPQKGFFFAPMVIGNNSADSPALREELFGPVAAIVPFSETLEAISIANDTSFGLSASIWTEDVERGNNLAALIDAGTVVINGVVSSDPCVPFGGIKASGFGRELGREGMEEFVNVKVVWVA